MFHVLHGISIANDARNNSEIFRRSEQAQIFCFSERHTSKILDKNYVPCNTEFIVARFASLLKNTGTANEITKERYIAQKHKDKVKLFVIHMNLTLRQSYSKVIV